MKFAKLRKKLDIQKVVETQNAHGEPVETWKNFANNRWAEIISPSGTENFRTQHTIAEVDRTFKLRYIKGIVPKMRVVFGGENYNIESVVNVNERNRELLIGCNRVTT
jgi:SPP1 family predicted phage head-tail adaptor